MTSLLHFISQSNKAELIFETAVKVEAFLFLTFGQLKHTLKMYIDYFSHDSSL